jgi:hypothetical protein
MKILTRIEPAGTAAARVGVVLTPVVGDGVGRTSVGVGGDGCVESGSALAVGSGATVGAAILVGVGAAPPQPTNATLRMTISQTKRNDERWDIRTFLSAGSPHPYLTTNFGKKQCWVIGRAFQKSLDKSLLSFRDAGFASRNLVFSTGETSRSARSDTRLTFEKPWVIGQLVN